jgi:YHS domain-containing protein/thiol-disulfide isomerase/thioredoxin
MLAPAMNALPAMAAQEPGIQWMHDLEAAKTVAKQTGRLVLLHFWTPSCAPCLALDQSVFNQAGVAAVIEQRFVPVKLNANENSATAMGFGLRQVPTDVILTPDGQVIGKFISPPTPGDYISEVTKVASSYQTTPGQAFANAAARAPMPPSLNSAYANLPVDSGAMPAAQTGLTPTVTTATQPLQSPFTKSSAFTPPGTPASATVTNSFATAGSPPITPIESNRTPASPVSVTNPMAAAPVAPQGPNFAPPPAPAVGAVTSAAATSPAPAQIENRYATMSPASASPIAPPNAGPMTTSGAQPILPPAQSASPAWGAGSQNQRAAPAGIGAPALVTGASASAISFNPNAGGVAPQQAAQPASVGADSLGAPNPSQLPPGAPPLGFDGYCPVSMRNHWKWVAGDARWGVVHRGRTYWFASQTEQQQFWTDPDRYSPALSGMDPVMAVDHQQQVPGKREHSIDYDNLFYMFSSEATLAQFTANPERYAVSVRQAMGIPRGRLVR